MEVQTKRLRIMPLDKKSFKLLLEGTDKMEKALGLTPSNEKLDEHTQEAMTGLYQMMLENEENYIWFTNWQIILKENNTSIGSACFMGSPNENGEIEIGYGINEEYRNKGYMTEAVIGMRDWALSQKDVSIFIAETEIDNLASHKVLIKSGLKKYKHTGKSLFWKFEK